MSAFSKLLAATDAEPCCGLNWIGKQLGHKGSEANLEAYVSELIDRAGFPKPLPHRKHGGGLSWDVSYSRSQWIRTGVISWLGDFLPPAAACAIDDLAREEAADEMDQAARSLTLLASNDVAAA